MVLLPSQDLWGVRLSQGLDAWGEGNYPIPSLRGMVTPNLACFLPVDGITDTRPPFSGKKKEACILKLVAPSSGTKRTL